MSIFDFLKKNNNNKNSTSKTNIIISNEEKYGKAWLYIVDKNKHDEGILMMKELDSIDFIEAAIALAMFEKNENERKRLVKKAADKGNCEGMWEYSNLIEHSFIPDPNKENDKIYEDFLLRAAEAGSADAMNEMGNIYNRRNNLVESMYWYAMAYNHDIPNGEISLNGIARKWVDNGSPLEIKKGSPNFDIDRFKSALCYLELYSDGQIGVGPGDMMKITLKGVSLAGYFTAQVFENTNNDKMAYTVYNALMNSNDAHAMRCCADMLMIGKGVSKDENKAKTLYQKSAELGERAAMFVTGEFLKETNKYLAAYWYGVSHTRGYQYSLDRLVDLSKTK